MRKLYLWSRDLHLYLGLAISPLVLVFAASVVLLNHPPADDDPPFVREAPRTVRVPPAIEKLEPATAGEMERLTAILVEALRDSGYAPGAGSVLLEDRVRRLVRRLSPQHADAELLLGMLRQILWRMRGD